MYADNADLFPWTAGFLTFAAMFGATIASESFGVLWRERRHWGFWHPLTQYRMVLLLISLVLVVGAAPDVIFLLTFGQVPLETSVLIRRMDLFSDMSTIFPLLPAAALLALSRWRIRDSLARGAWHAAGDDTYIEFEDADFLNIGGGTVKAERVRRPVFKTLPGLDIASAITRVAALIGLSLLAAGAVTIQWQYP